MKTFLTIQGGDYTVNLNSISEIEWVSAEEATVTMMSGNTYTFEGKDFAALVEFVEG